MEHAARKDPPHFDYFPATTAGRQAMLSMLSSAAWGGSSINEVDRIRRDHLSYGVAEMWNWREDKLVRGK